MKRALRHTLGDLDWKLLLLPIVLVVSAAVSYEVLSYYIHPSRHSLAILVTLTLLCGAAVLGLIGAAFLISLHILTAPLNSSRFNKYLQSQNFTQNIPAEVVIVLAYPNWRLFRGWYKDNFSIKEMRALIQYVEAQRQKFSVYSHASRQDIEAIMRDPQIKEVYFCGHGDSHTFMLSTDHVLYYCDFNRAEHGKQYVHQVHCGTPDGKRLIDYVVPPENQKKCFWFDRSITAGDIRREFEKRTKDIQCEQQPTTDPL